MSEWVRGVYLEKHLFLFSPATDINTKAFHTHYFTCFITRYSSIALKQMIMLNIFMLNLFSNYYIKWLIQCKPIVCDFCPQNDYRSRLEGMGWAENLNTFLLNIKFSKTRGVHYVELISTESVC